MSNLGTSGVLRFFAVVLIVLVGLVHLVIIPEHFVESHWIGASFIAAFLGALLAGAWVLQDIWLGWIVGFLVAAGAIALYIVSRTVGLPAYNREIGEWFETAGVFSLVVAGLFILLFLVALAQGARRQ